MSRVSRPAVQTLLVGLLVIVVGFSTVCHAQVETELAPPAVVVETEADDAEEAPPPVRNDEAGWTTSWYGWQPLLVDALSLGIVFGARGVPALFGVFGVAVGTPIVHAAHGSELRGLISFGVRVASVGLLVAGIGDVLSEDEPDDTLLVVGLVGLGAMMAADAFVLPYERVRAKGERRSTALRVLPWASALSGSFGLRIALSA